MESKDWYKLSFQIDNNAEETIIWKLNDLGISSFSFEYLKNDERKTVNVWLPTSDWDENSRNNFESKISSLLDINGSHKQIFTWSVIKEEDWLTSWKKYWGPELVGNQLLILPCWINLDEKYKNKKIIKIDPGAAFGTGSHPTTYLCLERIENSIFSGKSVLDIGSGSGILSIAAKSFGAKEIFAIDTDYLAINSTQSNFKLNFGNLDNLYTYLGSFNELSEKHLFNEFDHILCNILAEVIKEIIPTMGKCLKIKGEIILSGILNSQKDEIIKILNLNHLKIVDVSSRKDWVCIAAQKI